MKAAQVVVTDLLPRKTVSYNLQKIALSQNRYLKKVSCLDLYGKL
jgi:hypothetical protein